MKFIGNVEFKNKNSKPKDYHKTIKDKKTGIVKLEITKTYFPDYCEKCMKQKKK